MITLKRTESTDIDFIKLVQLLDADLKIRDGADHEFYNQFNGIDSLKYCVVCYEGAAAVGCGAIKPYNEHSMEVKRMYVLPNVRGRGIAGLILLQLEKWAKELGYSNCIMETGIKQPEAISLYKKSGYQVIPNYGQYSGIENSVCFEKVL